MSMEEKLDKIIELLQAMEKRLAAIAAYTAPSHIWRKRSIQPGSAIPYSQGLPGDYKPIDRYE